MRAVEPLIQHKQDEELSSANIPQQIGLVLMHSVVALAAWGALMASGYALNMPQISQGVILLLSLMVPLAVGLVFNRFRKDEVAVSVWLIGLIWFLIVALYVLDMPTGPGECYQCDATDKITRTFFSLPSPGGLLDNDGPFFATWPAAALFGYAIGAKLGRIKR